jgi:16S rRNA (cytosine967-C5)-methyltransferase
MPPPLEAALAIGIHQLYALDRIPAHAALDATVESLRLIGHPGLVGVANAILRKLAVMIRPGHIPPEWMPQNPADLYSLPPLLIEHLTPLVSAERTLAALQAVPPLCTRTLPRRVLPPHPAQLRRQGQLVWWSDPVVALEVVAAGLAVVQDPSQAAVLDLSGLEPGETLLDVCAAPGGKARLAAERGAQVTACDIDAAKVKQMHRDLPQQIRCVRLDASAPGLAQRLSECSPDAPKAFDLVLCDVPCSNTGVLARRPEAKRRYDPSHLESLNEIQIKILVSAATLVAPTGRLLYSTCSLSPLENEAIADALPGWRIFSQRLTWPDEWQAGGYAAVLVRS